MKEEKKFNVDLLRLENILVKSASFSNKNNLLHLGEGTGFQIRTIFQPGINIDQNRLMVNLVFEADAVKSAELLGASCTFEISYYFFCGNLKELATVEDVIVIDDDLAGNVANIAYSTSRGIIFTRCQGTIFEKFILPIISTDELLYRLANG